MIYTCIHVYIYIYVYTWYIYIYIYLVCIYIYIYIYMCYVSTASLDGDQGPVFRVRSGLGPNKYYSSKHYTSNNYKSQIAYVESNLYKRSDNRTFNNTSNISKTNLLPLMIPPPTIMGDISGGYLYGRIIYGGLIYGRIFQGEPRVQRYLSNAGALQKW